MIDGQNLGFNTAPTFVDVTISTATAVGAYQVTIGYDPNILKLIPSGVTGGTGAGFTGTPTVVNIDNTAGTVSINAFQTGNSPTGTFTVANLAFIPLSDGTSNLSLVVNVLTDTLGSDLTIPPAQVTLTSGSVTVTRLAVEDNVAPYTTSWDSLTATDGAHVLTVVATDLVGNSTVSASTNITVDNTAPTVSMGAPSATDTTSGPVTYTITYSGADSVTLADGDVTLNPTGTASGTVAVTGTGNTTRTVTISAISGDGTLGISLAAATASDTAGNLAAAAGPSGTFNVDNTPPTVSDANISLNQTLFKDGETVTVTWNNTAGGDDNGDIASVTVDLSAFGGGAAVVAADSSGTWTASATVGLSGADGSNLNASVTATDNAGNATTTADTTNATVDNTAPIVSVGLPSGTDTTSGPVTYTITYSGADSVTLADGDVTLNPTGTATGTVAVTGTGKTTRTVTISAISGDGTLGISLAAATASDTAGNLAVAAGPSGTFNVDNTAPTVSEANISLNQTLFKDGDTVTVTWDNTAGGDDNGDITSVTVNLSAFGGGAAVAATNSSETWTASATVGLSGVDGSNLNASVTATDNVGNATTTADTTNATVDNTAPTVSMGAPSATDTANGPVTYTITYSGADSVTMAAGDVTLNSTGTATGTVAVTGTGNTTRTVTISATSGDGTLEISLTAAAGPSGTFNVDNTAPTVSEANISLNQTLFKDGDTVTVTWNNTAGGDDNGDIGSVTVDLSAFGGGAAVAATNSSETWTASATVGLSGADGSNLNASVRATDNAENATTTADATNATVDNTAPTVSIGLPSATDTTSGPVTYTISYSGADSVTLADGDVTLNATGTAAVGTVAVTGTGNTTRTVTISAISGDGTLGISMAAATASDTAGNLAAAAGPSGIFNVDNTAPTTALTEPADGSTFGGSDVTLAATAADAGGTGVAGVRFLIDGQNLGFNTAPTSVDVTISSATPVGAYQVRIGYDPDILKLEPSGIDGGTGAGFGTVTSFNIDNTTGTVTVNAFQTGNSPTGTFTVANLAFTASLPLSEGTSNLTLVVDALTDTFGNDLTIPPAQVTLTSGSVTVTRLAIEDNVAPYSTSWDSLTATDGAHVLSVVAIDLVGNSTVSASINVTVDNTAPTVTEENISLNQTLFKDGETVTVTWDNTAGGDDNGDIASVTVNLGAFGGGAAVVATNSSGTWTASATVNLSGADGSNLNASVTATDNAGNATTTADTTNATVDNTAPTVSDANIGLNQTLFKDGDTVTVTWDNTGNGDDNGDIASVTLDLSAFGGGAAVVATNSSETWTASATVDLSGADGSNLNASVTATDNAGNATGTADTTNATVDNAAPTVTDASISLNQTLFKDGDTVTVTWDNTGAGDDNGDIASVAVDLSAFGGGAAVAATNSSETWTASAAVSLSGADGSNLNASVTATDNAGNATGTADTTNATVDNTAPTVSMGAPSASDTTSGPVTYTITYSGADSVTLADGDVTLDPTGTATGTVTVCHSRFSHHDHGVGILRKSK